MIDVQFPDHPFKIRRQNSKEQIFDPFRRQWFLLTPEEWVRQNFLQYLTAVKNYPAALIAVEREVMLGELKKRFDIVVFNDAKPWMIIECKEMQVELNEAVIRQILNYNISLQVSYLVVTNGRQTYALHIQNSNHEWINELPEFKSPTR